MENTTTHTLLCIDTSSDCCTVGLVSYTPLSRTYTADDITVMAETVLPMGRGHAEHIMPAIVNILKLTNINVTDLHGVAATVGPGAFTGIRIGLATAKGLCLPHNIPCIGVCNAHAVIEAVTEQTNMDTCTVILGTKRTDYYISTYQGGKITGHQSLAFDDAVHVLPNNAPITGDGVARFIHQWQETLPHTPPHTPLPPVLACPTPLTVVHMAISALNAPLPPAPIYVRPPDVQPPKSGLVAQHSLKPKIGKKG